MTLGTVCCHNGGWKVEPKMKCSAPNPPPPMLTDNTTLAVSGINYQKYADKDKKNWGTGSASALIHGSSHWVSVEFARNLQRFFVGLYVLHEHNMDSWILMTFENVYFILNYPILYKVFCCHKANHTADVTLDGQNNSFPDFLRCLPHQKMFQ